MENSLSSLPDWLEDQPNQPDQSGQTRQARQVRTLQKGAEGHLLPFQYESAFEQILDKICAGQSLTAALRDDVREFDRSQFVRWINKDPIRRSRYHEAQEIGAEVIAGEMIEIADGTQSLEGVQRSTLRINTRKYLLGVWNRKRYGEVKQVEMNGTISVTKALEQANSRLLTLADPLDVIDVPSKEISSE